MSRAFRTVVAAAAIAGVAAVTPAHAQDRGEVHLVIGTGYGEKIAMNHLFRYLVKPRLVKYSGGRISVDLQQENKLCSEHKCIEQVKLGQIDIGSSSSGNMGAFGKTFNINFLPFIFASDTYAQEVLNGWLGEYLREQAREEMGLHLLGSFVGGNYRALANTEREVRVPSDLTGIKIRVTKSPVEFNLIKEWGGTPVPYDWGQLYEGLQSRVVQGMYIPYLFIALRNFHEVTPYITETGGGMVVLNVSMSANRWDGLPDWAKEVVTRVFAEMGAENTGVDRMASARSVEILESKAQLYYPTPEESEQWFAAAPAAWLKVKGQYDPAIARRLLEEQGQTALIGLMEEAGAL